MKRLAQCVASLAVFATFGACAAPLATLPPSDTYKVVEGEAPQLTDEEKDLVADVNAELERMGLPAATPGAYEQNAATVMANAGLAKVWAHSGRALTQDDAQVIQAPVSGEEQYGGNRHQVANGRLASLTDETEDVDLKHLHTQQRLIARGIPSNTNVLLLQTTYAQTRLGSGSRHGRVNESHASTELIKLVRTLRPREVHGELMIGAVVLPAGDADARIFAVAIRDRTFDLSEAPPRVASPGQSFTIAGTVVDKDLKNMKVGMLAPDGQDKLGLVPVDTNGKFTATLTLPSAAGMYVVSVGGAGGFVQDSVKVPVFAGVPLAVWPPSADPKATPVEGTRSFAKRLAQSIEDYRKAHGLKPLPIDATLSAFAKNEATLHAAAEDQQAKNGAGTPQQAVAEGLNARLNTAGYSIRQMTVNWAVQEDDYLSDYFVRFPGTPSEVAAIGSPTAEQLGLGVALVPNVETKDSELVRYSFTWMVKDPAPPKPEVPGNAQTNPGPAAPTSSR